MSLFLPLFFAKILACFTADDVDALFDEVAVDVDD
jgi:hypothetical protein